MYLDALLKNDTNEVVFNSSVADMCSYLLNMNPELDSTVRVVEGSSLRFFTVEEYLTKHNLKRAPWCTLDEMISGLKEGRSFKRDFSDGGFEMVRGIGDGQFEHVVAGLGSGGMAELSIDIIDEERWGDTPWQELK